MNMGALKERLGFVKAEALLLAPFLATVPLYSPSLAIFHDLLCTSEDLMSYAMYAMMFGSIAIGLLFAVVCLRRDDKPFVSRPAVVAGAACFLGGYLLLAAVFQVEALGLVPLAVLCGVLMAVGTVELGIACGIYMSAFDMRQSLFIAAVAVGLSALLRLVMNAVVTNLATTVGVVLFALLAAAGVVLPLWKALTGELACPDGPTGAPDAELAPLTSGSGAGILQSVKRMAQVAGMPFIGLLVFAFVMGVRKTYVLDVIYTEMISDLIGAVLVLPLALFTIKRPLMPFIYRQVIPVCTLVLIVLNSFPDGSTALWLGGVTSYVMFSVLAILALACLSAMAHAREFPPGLIFSASVAFFALLSVAGIQCGTLDLFAGENGDSALAVVNTVFFAFILLVALLQLGRQEEVKAPDETPSKENELLVRCRCVAQEGGLSPRETEVLAYLGRGHGVAFVADSLVVSESTVRTHVKNIYRKLGVSSREELLQLIDEKPIKE